MNKNRLLARVVPACVLLMSVALSYAQERKYLNIGDPAPALKPAKWLKGSAISKFEKGQVYVVEFWATWCGPCKENIPHLTELAKKFKGKASISGISIWESQDAKDSAYMAKVESFVKAQGVKMDYNVAVDGPKSDVANAWMKAADENGIPATFIIGKDGKVAWIGHPAKLEEVLSQVVEDKFDVAAARNRRATEVETTRPISEAMQSKKYPQAVKLIDAVLAKHPDQLPMYAYQKLTALFHCDLKGAIELSEQILKETQGEIGVYRMIASIHATEKDLSTPAYDYGREIIAKALEKGEMKYMFLAMNAEVSGHLKQWPDAVKNQEAAVKEAEADSHAPKPFIEFLKKKLEEFRAKAKLSN